MQFQLPTAELYIPDGTPEDQALSRTTHLAIGAHQDDLEIMAIDGILKCFENPDQWFTGVVVTNGSGPARGGVYGNYTDEQMIAIRNLEQKRAAMIGDFSAQFLLDYPSSTIKDAKQTAPVDDLCMILESTRPEIVYTHNLADKHPTHIGVVLRVIEALRRLPADARPKQVYGCEVWRNLDWMLDEEKVVFDTTDRENLQQALIGVFDSQIYGAKRYDTGIMGRRKANATFFESHGLDRATGLAYAMDLTPLMQDPTLNIGHYVQRYIDRFSADVQRLIAASS
jgi:LmbE family N-acetylglucosaminyl deacetylase